LNSQAELEAKLVLLEPLTDAQRKAVTCSLIGHSRIQTACFGYFNCARCGEQLGDSLGGCYDAKDAVIVGHDCETCRKNFETCTWKDTFLAPDPFARGEAA